MCTPPHLPSDSDKGKIGGCLKKWGNRSCGGKSVEAAQRFKAFLVCPSPYPAMDGIMTIIPLHFTTDRLFANHTPLSEKFLEKIIPCKTDGGAAHPLLSQSGLVNRPHP